MQGWLWIMIMEGWLWIVVPIAIGVLSALGSPDEKGREGGIQFMSVVLFWRAMYLIAFRTDFGRSVWAWAVWLAKLYFFWMSGFFILYYIYRAFANMAANTAKEAEKWDRTVRTEANGRTVITMVNRETGQRLEEVSSDDEPPPDDDDDNGDALDDDDDAPDGSDDDEPDDSSDDDEVDDDDEDYEDEVYEEVVNKNVRREGDEDMTDDSETWDRTVRTEANGRTVITMVNRETGQWLEKVLDSDVLVHVESCTSRGCWPERPTRGRRGHEGRF